METNNESTQTTLELPTEKLVIEPQTTQESIVLNWNFNYEFNGEHHSHTKYIIYQIENTISQKYYIGQTRRELKYRWKDYKRDLLKPIEVGKRKGSNAKLKYSVQKHYKKTGNIDFLKFSIVEVLDVSHLSTEEEKQIFMNEKEIWQIKEYRKLYGKTNVFNVLDGGIQHVFTKEEKELMSKTRKGRKHTKETKQKISNALSGESNPMYGKIPWNKGVSCWSEEDKKRLSESHKGKHTSPDTEFKVGEMSGENNPFFGKKHTEKSREKIKLSKKGKHIGENNPMYGKRHNDEIKQKIGNRTRNKTLEDLYGIEKANEIKEKCKNIKVFDLTENPLISPTGGIYTKIECLQDFCVLHNLTPCNMSLLLSGKRRSHRQWRLFHPI